MFRRIEPLGDRVLVERTEMEDKTEGGIIIPETAKGEKTQTGKVIAAGQGKLMADGKVIPMAVKVGDVVFFGKYSGTDAGDEHLIIGQDEILGIIK